MAHKKGLGSSRNGRDSNSQRLGTKIYRGDDGENQVKLDTGENAFRNSGKSMKLEYKGLKRGERQLQLWQGRRPGESL